MGTNLPAGRRESIEYIESVLDQWTANQASLGVTSAAIINLTQEVESARAAFTSVETIRTAARAETKFYHDRADSAHKAASDIIASIKGHAAASATPSSVYELAGLTPKDAPQPVPAPKTPTGVRAVLAANGTVNVTFKGKGPAHTLYEVYRRLVGETSFTLIGIAHARDKNLNDAALPAAQTLVFYQVRAVRGKNMSAFSAQTAIQFGPIPAISPAISHPIPHPISHPISYPAEGESVAAA